MNAPATIDLFSGPRGWDVGARLAGLPDALGIEHDRDACATSEAAGFPTLQADVAALDPTAYLGATGLIASPPCQAWSAAGKGLGRTRDVTVCEEAVDALASAETARQLAADGLTHRDLLATYATECQDPRSILVAEPLRWALALRPAWMAWEQVPPVLPFWERCADLLRAHGHTVWTGLLRAEQYGVPQTRTRAFLLARWAEHRVAPPRPTHRRYLPPKKHDGGGLFDVTDLTERRVHPEDHDLAPWISMADALGWGMTERPAVTVMAKPSESGGRRRLGGGSGSEATIAAERDRGAWHPADLVGFPRRDDHGGDGYRDRDLRPASEPAQVVTEKARSWSRWPFDRPATTVACDPRIAPPGWRGSPRDYDDEGNFVGERSMTNAVRVTVEQAAALQSFPPDHPWQGTRSAQFTQVGNAVPPLLAQRVLEAIARPEISAARGAR